ncbi:MAG TPA: YjjI family glycine radical enzyme [Symbiobacteriaceae bacterium]|nr:YjjI family glycine radical enzyme [Symbiobacteriaceae bacterium]
MRNPVTMAAYEDLKTGLTAEKVGELRSWVSGVLRDTSLTPDQRRATLAVGAAKVLPHLPYSDAACQALAEGTVCMLGEVPLPFWPRYTAPDYARLLRQGSEYLRLKPARDLHDALAGLLSAYQYSATVTLEPVWLGNLDTLLEPYFDSVPEPEARRAVRSFWTVVSRLFPSSFVHANIGPGETRMGRLLLELDRETGEPVNTSFKYAPGVTPEGFAREAARCAMGASKPYFHNHALSAADWGEEYAIASCYNLMPVGGGIHTLVRVNLGKVATRAESPAHMLEAAIPEAAALLCEIIAARCAFLGAEAGFLEHSFLVKEGLLRPGAFTAYAGVFGLAEAVNGLMGGARYGHDAAADRFAIDIIAKLAECVAATPMPFCAGSGGKAVLHAQVGIDSDTGYTPAARIPPGDEPDLYDHLRTVSPHDRHFTGGVSNIFEFEATAADNPQAVLDIVRGAFSLGCRNLALGPSGGDLIRVTGYLMRRSDLTRRAEGQIVRGDGALFGSAFFVNQPEHLHRRVRSV